MIGRRSFVAHLICGLSVLTLSACGPSAEDRAELHKQVGGLLQKMGADDEFIKLVIKRNFEDEGFLKQQWSEYNIPYFFIYERDSDD